MPLAPHPAETAPQDGRVIRGWFKIEGGAMMIAVSWSPETGWVDLNGDPVPDGALLKNWGGD